MRDGPEDRGGVGETDGAEVGGGEGVTVLSELEGITADEDTGLDEGTDVGAGVVQSVAVVKI